MKKIIMLITMFVLSVGFLMAQNGVFNYQAVVVDADGNLVVDQDVTADVYVYNATGTVVYQEQFTNVHSSLNAMVVLPIGSDDDPAFAAVDWKTASVKVVFTATDVTIPDYGTERVPGVPYALQSMDDELTTEMIVDYYSRASTTMDDMEAIFQALEDNPNNLAENWKAAFIDTIINNRDVAKEIVLHYLNTGTADDVQAMFDSLSTNENAMAAIIADLKDLIGVSPSAEVREILYDILSDYTRSMTPTDVNDIYTHLSDAVKLKFAQLCVAYLKDHKTSVIMPVAMDYLENITVDEFEELVQTLENNAAVYPIMLAQFNEWLDEYFESRYSGGNHVKDVVASTIAAEYYDQCTPPVDLCELKENLDALNTCFALKEGSELSFEKSGPNYVCMVEYEGSDPTNVVVTLAVETFDGSTTVTVQTIVNASGKKILMVAGSEQNMPELLPGEYFTPTMTVTVGCSDTSIVITGESYIEP